MDKTVKTSVFSGNAKSAASQSNLTEAQEKALELMKKNAQLEAMNSMLLEHLKTIEQLRESFKQEQAKTAEMAMNTAGLEAKVKELAEIEAKVRMSVESEVKAKEKECAELGAKVKELSAALSEISRIAATGKVG